MFLPPCSSGGPWKRVLVQWYCCGEGIFPLSLSLDLVPFLLGFSVFSCGELLSVGSFHGVRGSRTSTSLLNAPLRVHGGYLSLGCPFGSMRSSWSSWVSMLFNLHIMLHQCLDSGLLLASSGVEALGLGTLFFPCRQLLSSIAPFSPLSVPVFGLHGDVFEGKLWWLSRLRGFQ